MMFVSPRLIDERRVDERYVVDIGGGELTPDAWATNARRRVDTKLLKKQKVKKVVAHPRTKPDCLAAVLGLTTVAWRLTLGPQAPIYLQWNSQQNLGPQ